MKCNTCDSNAAKAGPVYTRCQVGTVGGKTFDIVTTVAADAICMDCLRISAMVHLDAVEREMEDA